MQNRLDSTQLIITDIIRENVGPTGNYILITVLAQFLTKISMQWSCTHNGKSASHGLGTETESNPFKVTTLRYNPPPNGCHVLRILHNS